MSKNKQLIQVLAFVFLFCRAIFQLQIFSRREWLDCHQQEREWLTAYSRRENGSTAHSRRENGSTAHSRRENGSTAHSRREKMMCQPMKNTTSIPRTTSLFLALTLISFFLFWTVMVHKGKMTAGSLSQIFFLWLLAVLSNDIDLLFKHSIMLVTFVLFF